LANKCIASSETETEDKKKLEEGSTVPGKYIASGSRDKTIKIFDTMTGSCIMTLEGHDNWVRDLCFHSDGKHIISVSDDKTVRIWNLRQRRCIRTINDAHQHFISCLDFRNNHFATGSVDKTIKLWPLR